MNLRRREGVRIFNYAGNPRLNISRDVIKLEDFKNKPIVSYLYNTEGSVVGYIDEATRIDGDGFVYGNIYTFDNCVGDFSNYGIKIHDFHYDETDIIVESMEICDVVLDKI